MTVSTRTSARLLSLISALASLGALAQVSLPSAGTPVKPRVFVIFDSSTSMQEDPRFKSNYGLYLDDDTQVNPDTDTLGDCRSKFCIAKNVMYEVLKSHTADVRIGLATYYQYLAKYTPRDDRETKCWYDGMFKPGFTLYFPAKEDSPTPLFGLTAVGQVATGVQLGGNADGHHRYCKTDANATYDLTLATITPSTIETCTVYNFKTLQTTFGATGSGLAPSCVAGETYGTSGTTTFQQDPPTSACPGLGCFKRDYPAGASCPTPVTPSSIGASTPSSLTVTAAANTSGWVSAPNGCTSAHPCEMYSAGAGRALLSNVSWYALFDGNCGGGMNAGNGAPSNCINPSAIWPSSAEPFRHATRVDSTIQHFTSVVTTGVGGSCTGTVGNWARYQSGQSRGTFMSTGDYNNAVALLPMPTGYAAGNDSPANTTCTTSMPCDVRLVSQTAVPQPDVITYANNCPSPLPAGVTCTQSGSQPGSGAPTVYRLLKTGASCPVLNGPYPSAPAGQWQSSPTCGTGQNQCNFTAATPSTQDATASSCPATVSRWDTATQPACVEYGRTFTYTASGAAAPTTVAIDIAPTDSCWASGTDAKSGGVPSTGWATGQATLTQCRGASGACTLQNMTSSTSPVVGQSGWKDSPIMPTGEGWDPASLTYRNRPSTNPIVGAAACTPAETVGSYVTMGGNVYKVLGNKKVGTQGESAIMACQYQQQQVQWTRPLKRCQYTIKRQNFTTDNSITWCQYNLNRYRIATPVANRMQCTYENVIRRFDFNYTTGQQCDFYRMATTGARQLHTYSYSYETHGGEFAGAYSRTTPGDVTDPSVPYSSFNADCPPVVDDCLGVGTTCYLKNGPGALTWSAMSNDSNKTGGRYVTKKDRTDKFTTANYFPARSGARSGKTASSTTNPRGISCVAADYHLPPPVTEPVGARASLYAVVRGDTPGPVQYKLISDYYACSDDNDPSSCQANAISAINTDARIDPLQTLKPGLMAGGPFNALTPQDWTNVSTKAYGFSGTGGDYTTPSQMFATFADDSDASGNALGLRQLFSKCERPNASNIVDVAGLPLSWNGKGICMPDLGSPNPGLNGDPLADFTPLYGSLQNAKRYIAASLASDTTFTGKNTCRPYYVILATDGAENTPSKYADEHLGVLNATRLANAVDSLHTVSSGSRDVDVKTYVVGFGDATTDPQSAALLNAMAAKGGTGATTAYFADDKASLMTELNRVFSSILQGSYSRSKPVISTDGHSIYATQFDRTPTTPEWPGRFYAYGIDSNDGSLTQRWQLGDLSHLTLPDQLNTMSDSDRNIYTDEPGSSTRYVFKSSGMPTWLANRLTAAKLPFQPFPSASDIVKFVRNKNNNAPYFQATNPPLRQSRLNAIVHAAPVVVGKSVLPPWWGGSTAAETTSFTAFQSSVDHREERVLVGSTDGILRALRESTGSTADDGREAWGWVPSPVQTRLHKSMLGLYNGMDGQIAATDVCGDASGNARNCSSTEWKTVAIASTGRGGRGMLALDITKPNDPVKLWDFDPSESYGNDFGYAVSAPVIGRVERGSKDQFLAVFGGGLREQGVDGTLPWTYGNEVYMLDAITGSTVEVFDGTGTMNDHDIFGQPNQFAARPSFWERMGSPFMDHAMFGAVNGRLYISRFRKPVKVVGGAIDVSPRTNTNDWHPTTFFDPTSGATSKSPSGASVGVRRIEMDPVTSKYVQTAPVETLPLSRSLPIYVRPRSAPVEDPNRLVTDYFVGTGDGIEPGNPRPEFTWNYFYAIHDANSRDDGKNDGAPLWVNQFIFEHEQVVSEPAMIGGVLIVATYLPPTTTSPCDNAGDALLYCFNPRNGDLVDCFENPDDGTLESVRIYEGVGIPSDLVSVGKDLYWTASNLTGDPQHELVRPPSQGGDVRSWRRVR